MSTDWISNAVEDFQKSCLIGVIILLLVGMLIGAGIYHLIKDLL